MIDSEKFRGKYRIPPARLQGWDYGSPGLYFITICTKNGEHFFGEIIQADSDRIVQADSSRKDEENSGDLLKKGLYSEPVMQLTEIGKIAEKNWIRIPEYFPFVELDAYVVMPNHLHGILFLNKPDFDGWKRNTFGPQSQNLPAIIRGYKASVTRHATQNQIPFAWLPRYYDRIIRSEMGLRNIRAYIFHNPLKWQANKDNPVGILM